MNRKLSLRRIAVLMAAVLMLVPFSACGEPAEDFHFGKTEASVEKKTVPYVNDFGEDGRTESETNIYFVDGGDIPYVAVSEYMPFLSEVLALLQGGEPID